MNNMQEWAQMTDNRNVQMKRHRRKKKRTLLFLFGTIIFAVFVTMAWASGGKPIVEKDGFTYNLTEGLPISPSSDKPSSSSMYVMIDPGHGGRDPGCVFDEYDEKDLNLSLALKVKKNIESLGFVVVLTREDDSTVSIENRISMVEDLNPGVFVSIHHNSLENDVVTEGIETWYSNNANESNSNFASIIQKDVSLSTQGKDRGTRISENLRVLKELSMPSCLIEAGFLSSDKERLLLVKADYQDKIVQGISDGIVRFFKEQDLY